MHSVEEQIRHIINATFPKYRRKSVHVPAEKPVHLQDLNRSGAHTTPSQPQKQIRYSTPMTVPVIEGTIGVIIAWIYFTVALGHWATSCW